MFSQVSVILSTGQVHMAGGVCMGGAWQGACMTGGHVW